MGKWQEVELDKLCDRIGDGLHGTPDYVVSTEFKFINGNNIKDGRIVITESTKHVSEEVWKRNYIDLNSNSLLMSINGTIGSLGFYNDEKSDAWQEHCVYEFQI